MADFSTGAELVLEVDDRSLSRAKSRIESELGNVSVGVNAAAATDGGTSQLDAMLTATEGQRDNVAVQTELAEERNEILFAINETLEDRRGGALAGMGGGGFGEAASGGFFGSRVTNILQGAGAGGAAQAGARVAGPISIAVGGRELFDYLDDQMNITGNLRETLGFDSEEPIINQVDLDSKFQTFKWPEVGVNDILKPIGDNIDPISWNVPGAESVTTQIKTVLDPIDWNNPGVDSVVGAISDNIDSPDWKVPKAEEILPTVKDNVTELEWNVPSTNDMTTAIIEFFSGDGGGGSGGGGGGEFRTGRINPPQVDNTTEITVEADDTNQILSEVEKERKRDMERLRRKIERGITK